MDIEVAKASLTAERAKLVEQLTELGATEKGELTGEVEFGDGFADAAAATAERTEVLGIVDNLHTMLQDVDTALSKIEKGTYGKCDSCGNDIGEARLAHRPNSHYCVDCKAKR